MKHLLFLIAAAGALVIAAVMPVSAHLTRCELVCQSDSFASEAKRLPSGFVADTLAGRGHSAADTAVARDAGVRAGELYQQCMRKCTLRRTSR